MNLRRNGICRNHSTDRRAHDAPDAEHAMEPRHRRRTHQPLNRDPLRVHRNIVRPCHEAEHEESREQRPRIERQRRQNQRHAKRTACKSGGPAAAVVRNHITTNWDADH